MIVFFDFASPLYDEAVALRQQVLRKPLGLDIANDPLHEEWNQVHLGWVDTASGLLACCCLQDMKDKGYKMRQVAVHPQRQGLGLGRKLVAASEAFAKTQHAASLYCHARASAVPFYESCKWTKEGELFQEVGIDHYLMRAW